MSDARRRIMLNLEWRTTVFTLLTLPLLTGLGFWQLQRADEKAALESAWEERQAQPPVAIEQLRDEAPEDLAYMPVKLSGVFLANKYFLLDNRIFEGRFGYEVIGIMSLDGGQGLALVNRGWLAGDPARMQLPAVPRVEGRVELSAHVYVAPGPPYLLAEQRLDAGWPKLLQALEMDKVIPVAQEINGDPVFPYPVRINSGAPGALSVDWQVVNVSPDKHGAYAAQWFTMALFLLIFFVLRSSNLWQLLKPSGRDHR